MRLLLVLLAAGLAGCASSPPPSAVALADATLSGTVTYLPRIALPPDAEVTVRLLDVSLADAPSTPLAEATIALAGRQVPVPFALTYAPDQIEPRRRYVVRAEIRDGAGALRWATDTAIPVLTQGGPSDDVEVRVVQVAADAPRGPHDREADPSVALVGPTWRLVRVETGTEHLKPDADRTYTLTFDAEGRYTGQEDCNRYGGAFTTGAGDALDLAPGPVTLAACLPTDAAVDLAGRLANVERYAVIDGRLTLRGSNLALVFERAGGDTGGMSPQPTGQTLTYACDAGGDAFEFTLRTGPGEIALWLPERFEGRAGGTYHVLGQVRAASGAKYQDGPVTVWTRGDEALLEVDGQTFDACRRATD
jgi:uncharacterized lipoprotein YbaY/membrane-bound inhibitor of C-type lysozyme/heat shock protein HslJ